MIGCLHMQWNVCSRIKIEPDFAEMADFEDTQDVEFIVYNYDLKTTFAVA